MSTLETGLGPDPRSSSISAPSHEPTPPTQAVALQPRRTSVRRRGEGRRDARKKAVAATIVLPSMTTSLTGAPIARARVNATAAAAGTPSAQRTRGSAAKDRRFSGRSSGVVSIVSGSAGGSAYARCFG
jgi:hypothetical protein